MDNSKYLELVDLVGAERAKSVVEMGAELQADQAEWLRKKAIPNGSFPEHAQNHELLSPAHPDVINWRGMSLLCHDLDNELVALPWQCEYCGSTNPGEALYCGQCGPSHCGAPKPGCDEPPRGILQLREPEPLGYVKVKAAWRPDADQHFYPASNMEVTITHPGKSFEDCKLELGKRVLAAFQRTIKGVLSLC